MPGAGNPLAWDRYAYALWNSIRFSDPTGHCIFSAYGKCYLEDDKSATYAPSSQVKNFLDLEATFLSSVWRGGTTDPHSSAYAGLAYDKYLEVKAKLGRDITIREMLATVSYNEFGTMTGNDYSLSEEALSRQYFYFCGSDGVCLGNELWIFLGGFEAWYNQDVDVLVFGMSTTKGEKTANRIFTEVSWHSGWKWDRPFVFANLNMYPNAADEIKANGIGPGNAPGTSMVLNTDLVPEYIVWSPTQRTYWKQRESELQKSK